jgi:hypothetical protein
MLAPGLTCEQWKQSVPLTRSAGKEVKQMSARLSRTVLVATILAAGFCFAGCGDPNVAGRTYGDSDNLISIEFRYDGKVMVTMMGLVVPCTYTQKAKNITVTCNGAAQVFSFNGDGSLIAANSGLFGKLTKKK